MILIIFYTYVFQIMDSTKDSIEFESSLSSDEMPPKKKAKIVIPKGRVLSFDMLTGSSIQSSSLVLVIETNSV